MRLIDADKLIIPPEEIIARMSISNAPTITPDMAQVLAYESGKASADRPTGEWIGDTDYENYQGFYEGYKCSRCGYKLHWRDYCTHVYKNCPYCKARMEADNE